MKVISRPLTVLELLVLALIDSGEVNTIYDLRERVGLSWGGLRPSLRRLEGLKLLHRSSRGVRGRRDMTVTAAGEKALESQWQSVVRNTLSAGEDIETVVRALWLAGRFSSRTAVECAHAAAEERGRAGATETIQVGGNIEAPSGLSAMRAFARQRRLKAEAEILRELTQILHRHHNHLATPEKEASTSGS
jgi:DNA-binding MarR family transcriptional regulator